MSHSLEFECDIPYKVCPRSKGSIHLWITVTKARDVFVNNRTTENRRKYHNAVDAYANYFSQEPLKVIQDCYYCGKDGNSIKLKDQVSDGFHDFCNQSCYDKQMLKWVIKN